MIETIKSFILRNFEGVLVAFIIITMFFIDMSLVNQKFSFLNCYYIPVLMAGYYIGKRGAVMAAFLTVLVCIGMVMASPEDFFISYNTSFSIYLNIVIWGSFLIISAYVVGSLYDQREEKNKSLKIAYTGVIEILTKFIESVDRYTKGHSVRVAEYSIALAIAMQLSREECENIRVAALLHDIGKIDISTDLIQKAAKLSTEEAAEMQTHSEKGGDILSKVGGVLSEAVPLVIAHHEYFVDNKENEPGKSKNWKNCTIPLGARIIAVADSYDAIVTDRPYRKGRPPWEAMEELKKGAGTQFDPNVINAFRHVILNYLEPSRREHDVVM